VGQPDQPDAPGQPQQQNGEEVDPTPAEDRVDGHARRAGSSDQRTVYMWTFPHIDLPGRAKPEDFTRQSFARTVLRAYESTGKSVNQWCCFLEEHPLSRSVLEHHKHFHMLVQTDTASRWSDIARYLRSEHQIYAHASTSSSRRSCWAAFAYLYAPSARKPKDDLDQAYVLSAGHEDPPQQLLQRRQGIRRLQPVEIYDTIIQHSLDSCLKVYAFAARQRDAGDVSWVQFCMKQPARKLKELITTAYAMSTASATLSRMSLSHMQVLTSARDGACICHGRAIPGWQHILRANGISEQEYLESVQELFQAGGGKGVNHFYVGGPSTGKTALTRPLLALFGKYAFVKPQVSTTFALQGVIGAQALIWNDFRWPHPPLAWGDLLNLLDNEPFYVAVPKVDGQSDYHWNAEGKEGVISVLTANVPVVYVSGNTVNEVETSAWKERFGKNILFFQSRLESPDKRYKRWFQCTRRYAHWVLGAAEAPAPSLPASQPSGGVDELLLPPQQPVAKRQRAGTGLSPSSSPTTNAGQNSAIPSPSPIPPQDAQAISARPAASAEAEAASAGPSLALSFDAGAMPASQNATAPVEQAARASQPLRDLNLYLTRNGLQCAWTDVLVCARAGAWSSEVRAGGTAAQGSGNSKKLARQAAAVKYLETVFRLSSGS